jgi:RNA polymerase sigma-54 factor
MTENPMLEEDDPVDTKMETEVEPETDDTITTHDEEKGIIELDEHWQDYFSDSSDIGYVSSGSSFNGEDEEEFNTQIAQEESLKDHLSWQLHVSATTEVQREIGEYLIENIDEDGFLQVTLEDTAEFLDVPLLVAEQTLAIIQTFDPSGIGARNLSECLEIQCRHMDVDDDDILAVIHNHMDELERRRFKEIARALGVTEQHVQEISDFISTLVPRPGRQYSPVSNEYISPDVFVERVGGDWQIRVNDDGAPPLRISKKYQEMLHNKDGMTNEEYDFIKKKFQSAIWLIRNIEQRNRTLFRVTKAIMDKQENFLDEGITALKPLKLRDIADELGIHEATVCRVVNKKYVQTTRGLFELKYFFSTGLESDGNEDMSAKSVMEIIRNLIDEEDEKKPLSDQKITEILHKDHQLNIARRTVAKYREKMGILPTSKRKRV